MELDCGVFFRQYGDMVYLRHVGQRKDYVFDGSAGDVLDYLREHPGCSLKALQDDLAEAFELDDRRCFDEDIRDFTDQLAALGILRQQNPRKTASDTLRQQMKQLARQHKQLFSLTLELTYRCNERCIHCYVDDDVCRERELTLAEYRRVLDEAHALGCMNVLLTGGEVTMRSDYIDIAEYAVNQGFCVDIYTNGLALKLEHIQRLAQLRVNSVSFSIYGPNAQIHDAITRVSGSFDRTLRSMLLCKCAGIDTFAKTVVMRQNYEGLEELMQLGHIAGIDINTSTVVTASHHGRPASEFRLMDPEKYRRVIELAIQYGISEDSVCSPEGHEPGLCDAGVTSLCVDPYGNVMPCNAINRPIGNVRESGLEAICCQSALLKSLEELRFESVCPKEGDCLDARWCSMCIGSAYSESKSWKPTPDVCLMARGTRLANQNG